jgi:predicted ATP-dependent endonuclease of OLD family
MINIRLTKLKFDKDSCINFKTGVNYIVGLNASGKTTIFNLIQYLLGLKKDFGFFLPLLKNNEAALEVLINNNFYEFKRDFSNREIWITTDNGTMNFTFNSPAYNSFLLDLFKPTYNFELNDNVVTSLLREAFISNNNFDKSPPSYIQKEINLLKLGVNAIYPKKVRTYLKELKSDISQREKAFEQIKSYKSDVDFLFTRELPLDKTTIEDITNSTLQKYSNNLNEALQVFEQSSDFLSKLIANNDKLLNDKIDLIEGSFKYHLKTAFIDERVSLIDILEVPELRYSYAKRSIISLIFELTIQLNSDFTNGCGLLVNDATLNYLDSSTKDSLKDLMKYINKSEKVQYIEFITDTYSVDRRDVVYELGRGSRYA